MLQHQQEYAIYKEHLNAKAVTIYFDFKEYQEFKKELILEQKRGKL